MARSKFQIDGFEELEAALKVLEKLPQKCVTGAAKDGAKIVLAAAKELAPVDSGDLKKGIVMKGERRKKGKKVYDIGMDPNMRDVYSRQTATGKRRTVKSGGKVKYKDGDYYYPASMEFGFMKKDGTKVPGHHFLHNALANNAALVEEKMLKKLLELINQAWMKGR